MAGFMVGLEDVQGAGAAAAGHRVDEDQRVPFLEQVVGQVHAPDAVVDDTDTRIVLRDLGVADYLRAESVVTQEDVAEPGYQDERCHCATRLATSALASGSGGHRAGTPVRAQPRPAPPTR